MTIKASKNVRRWALCTVSLVLAFNITAAPVYAQVAAAPAQPQGQIQTEQSLSQEQIQQLVAPIALYPDSLLTQVLMASTYPLEVIEAARWSQANPAVKGQALESAMHAQSWDPSVKALAAVPQTLQMMSAKIDWTEQLGDAFLAQQQDVLDAVQKLRAEAQAAGNLQTTPQQVVTTAAAPAGVVASSVQRPIVIEPVNPDVYYVPVYNPAVVYGGWDYPTYPPFYWTPPGFVASNVVSFATGVAAGAAIWGGCDWWNHNVFINVNRYNIFNQTNITNNVWAHNPAHRGNVPYRSPAVAARFDRTNDAVAREALRDRVDVGQNDLFKDRGNMDRPDGVDPMRDRVEAQRPDAFRRPADDAGELARRMAPDARGPADLPRDAGDRDMTRDAGHDAPRLAFPRRPRLGDGGATMRWQRMGASHPEEHAGEFLGHMAFRRR